MMASTFASSSLPYDTDSLSLLSNSHNSDQMDHHPSSSMSSSSSSSSSSSINTSSSSTDSIAIKNLNHASISPPCTPPIPKSVQSMLLQQQQHHDHHHNINLEKSHASGKNHDNLPPLLAESTASPSKSSQSTTFSSKPSSSATISCSEINPNTVTLEPTNSYPSPYFKNHDNDTSHSDSNSNTNNDNTNHHHIDKITTKTTTTTTTTTKKSMNSSTKKKKHESNKPPKVARPKNSFLLYRQVMQPKILALPENSGRSSKDLSFQIATLWKQEPEEVKAYYNKKALEERLEHKALHPDYKYINKKKKMDIDEDVLDKKKYPKSSIYQPISSTANAMNSVNYSTCPNSASRTTKASFHNSSSTNPHLNICNNSENISCTTDTPTISLTTTITPNKRNNTETYLQNQDPPHQQSQNTNYIHNHATINNRHHDQDVLDLSSSPIKSLSKKSSPISKHKRPKIIASKTYMKTRASKSLYSAQADETHVDGHVDGKRPFDYKADMLDDDDDEDEDMALSSDTSFSYHPYSRHDDFMEKIPRRRKLKHVVIEEYSEVETDEFDDQFIKFDRMFPLRHKVLLLFLYCYYY